MGKGMGAEGGRYENVRVAYGQGARENMFLYICEGLGTLLKSAL